VAEQFAPYTPDSALLSVSESTTLRRGIDHSEAQVRASFVAGAPQGMSL
jgi:hypothetical protein